MKLRVIKNPDIAKKLITAIPPRELYPGMIGSALPDRTK
jgi:hypothetical protein